MSNIIKITAMMLALALAGRCAQAAEPTVINLSCDGTMGIVGDQTGTLAPVTKMGLVVNLAERTVSGFSVVARIDRADAVSISFSNQNSPYLGGAYSVMGGIDRVTGAAWATTALEASDKKIIMNDTYDLVCKVTNRLF